MKLLSSNHKRGLLTLALMLVACATVMAKAIIPFGILEQKPWEAKFYYATNASGDTPGDDWYAADFDDFSWGTITGPIAGGGLSYYNTTWDLNNTTYWVRCHFNLTAEDLTKFLTFYIANDDAGEAYVNGVQIYNVTSAANYNIIRLSDEAKAALKVGENVMAVKVKDTGSNRYMDFGLYASDFNDAVKRADATLTFTDDEENPWFVEGYNIIRRDNGKSYYASWLTATFTSAYRTELSYEWRYDYQQGLQIYIDGVLAENCGTGHTYYYFGKRHFIIEPGEHVIAFRDTVAGRDSRKYFEIKNLCLKELTPIGESSAISSASMPLTFNNNVSAPWTIEDGYVEHRSWGVTNSGSSISTTFTVTKTSNFSFDYAFNPDRYVGSNTGNISGYHYMFVYLNGILLNSYNGAETYNTYNLTLEPGEYTVEIKDSTWRSEDYYLKLKNIKLNNNWVNVELATPGTLGYEVLYSPGIDVLANVEFLKVKGKMNDSDWTDIKNMVNLKALDLSEAIITTVPNDAFRGKTLLSSVILPEGLESIGTYSFYGTTIRRINIPSTVTVIKEYAFQSTPMMYLTFAEGSQLKTIEKYAFQQCRLLQEVALPAQLETIGMAAFEYCEMMKHVTMGDAVTYIEGYGFGSNYLLEDIRFSDAIEEIRPNMCTESRALTQVHLPANLKRIDCYAFYNSKSLKEIEFPSLLTEIHLEAFRYSAIEKVELPINLQILGQEAFSDNSNLKEIVMPSFIESGNYTRPYWRGGSYGWWSDTQPSGYRNNFNRCPNIEKVTMRAATPPEVPADPFTNSRDKSVVTLVVPSFAVVNYKLDTYWKAFGSIIEGDDVDYWKITSPLMLTNNRRMQGTPDVDLYYNGQLTVGGAAPMTMDKFNMYFSEDNPGRLLNTCEDVSANEVTTKFSVAANKWYFITPIHDVNIADIDVSDEASYVFRYYDAENRAAQGATGSWKNVDTSVLKGGQGYIFHCNKACVITFPADADGQKQLFTTKDVTWNLTTNESETPANRSWNYVGNPYPCYYDIFYLDFTAPITVWNGSTYKAYSIADDDLVLRPMQSFFVQKPEAVDKIVFKKEGRQLLSTVAPHTTSNTFSTEKSSRQVFNIQIISNDSEATDETRVVLNNNANMGYELECDASKFMSFDASVPQIFTTDSDGNAYAINERPAQDGEVALAFYAANDGKYTINTLRADGNVQLIDNEEGKTVDITNDVYTFDANASSEPNTTRFTLLFNQNEATGVNEVNGNESVKASGVFYDMLGRQTKATQPGIYIQGTIKVVK